MYTTTLAYKYVVIAVMMAEVNFLAGKLQLKENLPIKNEDTLAQRVHEPMPTEFMGPPKEFTGGIDTPEYHFGFFNSGKSKVITKLEDHRWQSMGLYRGNESMKDFMEQLSQKKSIINTNDAYRIATNWLTAIGIDVERLEKENPLEIKQPIFNSDKRGRVPVPLFYIRWGGEGEDELGHHKISVVTIMISGINEELLNFNQDNDSYCKRPCVLVKDLDKLCAIPDEEFLKYSPTERSNLVARFAAVTYLPSTNELHSLRSRTNTPAKQ